MELLLVVLLLAVLAGLGAVIYLLSVRTDGHQGEQMAVMVEKVDQLRIQSKDKTDQLFRRIGSYGASWTKN
jgi:hypothetical protein